MIVRIATESQYKLPEEIVDRLNGLDNDAVAANAFRQHGIAKERAARVFLRTGVNRSVLGLHADCAASHAANGQLHRLFLLCALGAHIPRGALCSCPRPAV